MVCNQVTVVSVLVLVTWAEASILRCHQPSFTCPDSLVSCECQGAISVRWEVYPWPTSMETLRLFGVEHTSDGSIGQETSTNISLYSAILRNISQDPHITGPLGIRLTSRVSFNLTRSVDVRCMDNNGTDTTTLQRASKRTKNALLCASQM